MPSLTEKKPRKLSRLDRARAFLKRKGYSVDEIATRTNGTLVQVADSLERYDLARAEASNEEVDMAINQVILKNVERMGEVIGDAMKAKVVDRVSIGTTKKGLIRYRKTFRPDHAMQLKAVETAKSLMESVRPKGPGIAIQNNNQFGGGTPSPGFEGGRTISFEDRIRRRKQRHIEEGDIVEAEMSEEKSVADELNDIGIDIEEDDDDDDGDLSEE